jgi:hypothetical protein
MNRKHFCVVMIIATLAAAKVCYFAVTTPEFYLADELFHFDTLSHYSQLDIPRKPVGITIETSHYISPPPPWNHEALEPPLYYSIGGVWHAAGQALVGMDRVPLWDRLLGSLIAGATVWVGWFVARKVFPDATRQLIVPAFIAILPQRDLCGINNDVLSPLVAGLAVLALLVFGERPSLRTAAYVGLGLSSLLMTKVTTLPLIAVVGTAFLITVARECRGRGIPAALTGLVVGLSPAALWCSWNLATLGELTGAGVKIQLEAYHIRPVSAWIQHELFTPHGAWTFWRELCVTFWRGELKVEDFYRVTPLAEHAVAKYVETPSGVRLIMVPDGPGATKLDTTPTAWEWIPIVVTSGITLFTIPLVFLRQARDVRWGLSVCWGAFTASALFLAWASVRIQLASEPTWWEFPGFSDGRLISGAIVPFAVLFAGLCCWWKSPRGNGG